MTAMTETNGSNALRVPVIDVKMPKALGITIPACAASKSTYLAVSHSRNWYMFTVTSPAEWPRNSLRHLSRRCLLGPQSPNYQPRHQR